ncbi:alternative oxidase-domain containing protein [Nitzschia inconspicua]|uniref:Alternative oxidase-domain containing protein n=1 Tax=Nitzschia inconspicua TaxID=303405 RepID=A0A9K3P8N1_9STRA|nr:alternative oxidase-domain containing protein [Nitzschia inconspicua]KAG7371649.1 alternative oxidase-domain containing protein [Nitzschia inconspicua]
MQWFGMTVLCLMVTSNLSIFTTTIITTNAFSVAPALASSSSSHITEVTVRMESKASLNDNMEKVPHQTATRFNTTTTTFMDSNDDAALNELLLRDALDDISSFLKDTNTGILLRSDDERQQQSLPSLPPSISTATIATCSTNARHQHEQQQQQPLNEIIFHANTILIDTIYNIICRLYPTTGTTPKDFAKFYVLESVARVPYFAYLSCLHLRETFGERDCTEKMRIHYAQADNELHHLLIMEELGGNQRAIDRIVSGTICCVYFWFIVLVFSIHESAAYHLSEVIEARACNTYTNFLANFETQLQQLPVPDVAIDYYERKNPYWLHLLLDNNQPIDEQQQQQQQQQQNHRRRQPMTSLYDTFCHIRDDEKEHWTSLCRLVQYGTIRPTASGEDIQSTSPTNKGK